MGPEVAAAAGQALPYIIGGTALQMQGQREQRKDRSRILGQAMNDADQAQESAIQQVTSEADMLAPQRRMEDMRAAEDATYDRTMQDVGGITLQPSQAAGAVSPAFEQLSARRAGEEGARMSALARELAKLRAPGQVQTEGSMRRGAMSEALSSMFSSQRNRSRAAQMDAESVDMPGYGQLGQLISMAGSAYLAGAGVPQAGLINQAAAPVSSANIRWLPGGG